MSRLKLKQILSNLHYNPDLGQLIVSASSIPIGDDLFDAANIYWNTSIGDWEAQGGNQIPILVISGSTEIITTPYQTGSLTIKGIDSFGDSGSYYTLDLGEY